MPRMKASEVVAWAEELEECKVTLANLGRQIKDTNYTISDNILGQGIVRDIDRLRGPIEQLVGKLTLEELKRRD